MLERNVLDVPTCRACSESRNPTKCEAHTGRMATGSSTPMLQTNTPKRGASNRARHDYEGRWGRKPPSTQSFFGCEFLKGSWATRKRAAR